MSKQQNKQLKKRALDVLEEAHDIIKKPEHSSSSYKTAKHLTFCPKGETADKLGMDQETIKGDPHEDIRPYVWIDFEKTKGMGRKDIQELLELDVIKERDVINIDQREFSIRVIGEPQ